LAQLKTLLYAPEEAAGVPRVLMECGIRFVIVESLPKSKIDGACFWLDTQSPVIGISTRFDRIDNFWFVLRHEIEHVLSKHGQDEEVVDAELEGDRGSVAAFLPTEERIANAAAADFCVPQQKLESFIARKRPFFYEKDVLAFSRILNVHPGLVVGQMQRRLDRWDYLRKYQVKIRHAVLPGAIADGWGQAVPVSL
jgi:HTH-type transcriptional regulator/antitoxin HigA